MITHAAPQKHYTVLLSRPVWGALLIGAPESNPSIWNSPADCSCLRDPALKILILHGIITVRAVMMPLYRHFPLRLCRKLENMAVLYQERTSFHGAFIL